MVSSFEDLRDFEGTWVYGLRVCRASGVEIGGLRIAHVELG